MIRPLGYRKFLVINTIVVGAFISSFAFIEPDQPLWLRVIQFLAFGYVNSMQFSAMNSLTLKDLDARQASQGNSLFSMIQMLALSFGVAAAGALLTTFKEHYSNAGQTVEIATRAAFHASFVCLGLMTCASAWVFWQLTPQERGTEKIKSPRQHI